jgi:protein tyrosine phosphatase (PTP) superfamily phosphohydrolase (DUF442 family)
MKSIAQVTCLFLLFSHSAFTRDNDLALSEAIIDTPVIVQADKKFFQAGRFYFGGQPDDTTFKWFADQDVKIVFNLRTDSELETLKFNEDSLLNELGIKYIRIPLSAREGYTPASVDTLAKYLEDQEGRALIHCAVGGRVTLLWMAYLVRYRNISLDDAIQIGKKMHFTFPLEDLLGKKVTMKVMD